ncbi:MAG: pyridoxine 5'-phosphate synthase [Elusimicrobiota bacterium]|nr:pyridoxine 5'-phosphate synthase [Elusimicrobiota bacterium]
MIKLGVNIDHVATLRQARKEGIPDILKAARAAKRGGADGLTVHLRQDRRHIQDSDVYRLKEKAGLPLNLEMAAVSEIIDIALDVNPASVCMVPEKREELTTEGGLDAAGNQGKLKEAVTEFKKKGIEVSLFIDPDSDQIAAAAAVGADTVEIHTGAYANAPESKKAYHIEIIKAAAESAAGKGLKVNAGHGLDYDNVSGVKEIELFSEFNIGYSIICRAIFTGLEEAVYGMKALLK